MYSRLYPFLSLSILIHLLFILFFPNIFGEIRLKIIPFELIEEVYLNPIEFPEIEKKVEEKFLENLPEVIAKKIEASLGYSLSIPISQLTLPRSPRVEEKPSLEVPEEISLPDPMKRVLEGKRTLRGAPYGKGLEGLMVSKKELEEMTKGIREEDVSKVLAELEKRKPQERTPIPTYRDQEIQGPAAQRQVIYKPPLPEIYLPMEVEIKLKFWVLPNGTVEKVIPLIKGDAHLERVAIDYLKEWRFNFMEDGEKQWGTILVKFRLK